MTKLTITRERLEKIKSWRETFGAGSNVMLPAEEAEELARMALAAMDSEPAPVVPDAYVRDERGAMMLNGKCESRIGFGEGWNACRAAMLATAPQGVKP